MAIETKRRELQDELAGIVHKAEAIRKPYEGKSTNMSTSEQQEFDALFARGDQIKTELENIGKEEALKSFASRTSNALLVGEGGHQVDDKGVVLSDGKKSKAELEKAIFNHSLKCAAFPINERNDYWFSAPVQSDIKAYKSIEGVKAYQLDNPAGGGYLVTPQEVINEVLTLMKDLTFVRNLARVFPMPTADSLGVPAVDTDPSDSDWTQELGTGNEETTMAFGKRELRPTAVAKLVKESNKLLRMIPNVADLVLDRLSYKMSITQEKAFLSGTGAGQPLGVFTADSNGISTNRDVTAANSSSIVADDFINTLYGLKAQYRKNSQWILNRTVVKAARKLKDNNNNYIWSTALGPGTGFQGQPMTLLDRPVNESEYAPGTITTGLYTAIIGDFSRYYIADALNMTIQVLDQLYAATNQTGFILRMESDGMPVLEEAFSRLKQA